MPEHANNYLARGRSKMGHVRQGPVGGSDSTTDVSPLTGEDISGGERYHNLKDRMPVMPVSIWPIPHDRWNRDLRALVGDTGQLRSESFMGGSFLPSEHGARENAASIFNPVLAGQLIQAYTQPGDLIIDPFAGGGTRGIIAGLMERHYNGIDIRPEEVDRVNARVSELGLKDVDLSYGDAANVFWPDMLRHARTAKNYRKANALLTCPPYWNLEVYSADPNDLSTKPTYDEFLLGIDRVIERSTHGLRQGALSIWVVGEFRHPATSELLDFPGDVARLHRKQGFWIYDRIIYTHANPQAFWRMGVFDKTRKLIRVHEHIIVAKYGAVEKPSARGGRIAPTKAFV